jgi:hypothetical protein
MKFHFFQEKQTFLIVRIVERIFSILIESFNIALKLNVIYLINSYIQSLFINNKLCEQILNKVYRKKILKTFQKVIICLRTFLMLSSQQSKKSFRFCTLENFLVKYFFFFKS